MLLGGGGGENECGSNNIDYVISYLSLGFVIFALIIISIAVFANEITYQYRSYRKKATLQVITKGTAFTPY